MNITVDDAQKVVGEHFALQPMYSPAQEAWAVLEAHLSSKKPPVITTNVLMVSTGKNREATVVRKTPYTLTVRIGNSMSITLKKVSVTDDTYKAFVGDEVYFTSMGTTHEAPK